MSVTCAYTFDQFLAYSDAEEARWHEWFTANPVALDVPFADGRLATIRGLLVHIFAVELRYTERLCGRDVTSYDDIHVQSIEEIFALRATARTMLRGYLAGMTETDAASILTFATMTAGTLTASKHKIASNIFIHAIRHWAQVATTLRTAGFTKQWGHDVLLSDLAM
ncbi:MAG: DinB family protein [Gemmatimonadaceae bacterium]